MSMAAASITDCFQKNAVVVFVGAHPDDETTIGPLLAWAADRCRKVLMVSLTRGDGGWNLNREDLTRTLAEVREAEFAEAARVLGCRPVTYRYLNGASLAHPRGLAVPDSEETAWRRWQTQGDKGRTAESIYAEWTRDGGDPADRLLELFRREEATVILALEPRNGYTGHPEHVAATQATLKATKAYAQTTGAAVVMYYVWKPSEEVEGGERISSAALAAAGGKDYLRIANESWACHESQFGPRGSQKSVKYIAGGVPQCLLQAVPLGRDP